MPVRVRSAHGHRAGSDAMTEGEPSRTDGAEGKSEKDRGGPSVGDADSQLKRGLIWFGSASLVMRLLDVVANLVTLVFVTRQQMGLAAIPWTAVVVIEAFNGLGVGTAIVQARELSRKQIDSLFWFASAFGVLLGLLLAAGSPLIAGFYGDARLYPLLLVSAFKFPFVGAALVPVQLLARDLKFRVSGAIQTAATGLSAITQIVLAALGFGAWALVIAWTARGLFLFVSVMLAAPIRPRLSFALADTKSALSFGVRACSSSALYHFYRNADYLLVGKFLGLETLGIYRVAFDLAMSPLEAIGQVVNKVAYPVFSRIGSEIEKLVDAFYRMSRHLLFLAGPVVLFLFFGSEHLIRAINPERWLPAVPAVQILCWAALLRGLAQLFPQLYIASGKPGLAIYNELANCATLVGSIAIALWRFPELGIYGVCWAWLLSYPVMLTLQFRLARRSVPVRFAGYARTLAPLIGGLVAAGAAMGGATWALRATRFDVPVAALVLVALAGLVAYAAYLRLVLGQRLTDLRPGTRTGSATG